MKKFKFTLEAVHKVRELQQEREEQVLAEIQSQIDEAKLRLAEIGKRHFDAVMAYTEAMKKCGSINAFELELSTRHIESLENSIRTAKANVADKEKLRVEQSYVLAAANQQVKITEKLHENQKKEHRAGVNRQEQSEIDELVSASFARQMVTN